MRFLASVLLAADELKADAREARKLCDAFVRAYASALALGSARWIERDTARGLVDELLESLASRTRIEHLNGRTERKRGRRTLRCDGKHAMPVGPAERKRVTKMIGASAAARPDPAFFKVLDVAHRIAGTGSLGLERYVVLVEGKGSPDGNYLLDLKQSRPSSLVPHLKSPQPAWRSHAERIVTTQQRMQAVPMAFLEPVVRRKRSYVLRGLQPSEDRVELYESDLAFDKVRDVIEDMGRIVAWSQLRSSGRAGSAIADELIAFGRSRKRWHADLVASARRCARLVRKDWAAYCSAFDAGVLR